MTWGGVQLKRPSGVSLVELLVGLTLTSLLLLGGYRIAFRQVRAAAGTISNTRTGTELEKFRSRIFSELENVVLIREGSGTLLRNRDAGGDVPAGLVPLPGRSASAVPNVTFVVDPSVSPLHPNDAIRLVSLPADSRAIRLARDAAGRPFSTSGPHNPPIRVSSRAGEVDTLEEGDFALICELGACDLFRVTSLEGPDRNGVYEIGRSARSIWNLPFARDYGEVPGGATVQKAQVVTYAYDSERRAIVRDDHFRSGGNETAASWSPILADVAQFQVFYETGDPAAGAWTRSPRARPPDEAGNQVGPPDLRRIRLDLRVSSRDVWKEKPEALFQSAQDVRPPALTAAALLASASHLWGDRIVDPAQAVDWQPTGNTTGNPGSGGSGF